jgi:TonB family protein
MRIDTYAKVVLTVIFASACAACGQIGRASVSASSDSQSSPPSGGGQSASGEVDPQAAASRLWAAILTQCGDSFYLVNSAMRFRQPSFPPVLPDRVTEADRFNGFRWRGWAYLTGKVYAYCDKKGCSRWYDSEEDVKTKRENVFLKMTMWNLNGHWHFKYADFRKPDPLAVQLSDNGDEIDLDPPTITTFPDMLYKGLGASPQTVPLKKLTCAQIPGTSEYERASASERMTEQEKQQAAATQKAETEKQQHSGAQRPKGDEYLDTEEDEVRDSVYRVGNGITPPVAVFKPEPEYPEEARKAKYEGTVLVHLIVDVDGKIKDIKVDHSLGLGLDEKALECVRKWKFTPGKKNGRPVPVEVTVAVNFRLT